MYRNLGISSVPMLQPDQNLWICIYWHIESVGMVSKKRHYPADNIDIEKEVGPFDLLISYSICFGCMLLINI